MKDVYEKCPVLDGKRFKLRFLKTEDAKDLLEVYSDEKAVPFFNGDNCNGDNFNYKTIERMNEAIRFWIDAYQWRYFVRWTIVDKKRDKAIGTIEVFHRDSKDFFNNCGLLRLDLKSEYEKEELISEIMRIIMPQTGELFNCSMVATKLMKHSKERCKAYNNLGFKKTEEKLIGEDGREYDSYCYLKILKENYMNKLDVISLLRE